VFLIYQSRKENNNAAQSEDVPEDGVRSGVSAQQWVVNLGLIIVGLVLLVLATSVIATMRGERDIAVGNVVGSNIFNILAVIGLAAIVSPDGINISNAALRFDIPVMIAVAIACLPIFFTGYVIARWEGLVFLAYYLAYATYLILDSTQHDSLPLFSTVFLAFVIPITALTLVVVTLRSIQANRKRKKERINE
jgi:cation:H+ antiporter